MFLRCPFPIINSKTFIIAVETAPFASAARSDPERNPIRLRPQSDRTADASGDVSTETINVFELIIGKEHLKNVEYNSTYSIHWHDVCNKQNTTKPFCQKLLFI